MNKHNVMKTRDKSDITNILWIFPILKSAKRTNFSKIFIKVKEFQTLFDLGIHFSPCRLHQQGHFAQQGKQVLMRESNEITLPIEGLFWRRA